MGSEPRGLWDTFSMRKIGFAVQRRMTEKFGGDPGKMRQAAVAWFAGKLEVDPGEWNALEQSAFADFAMILALAPELAGWTKAETAALVKIIRAKASANETTYLRLLQQHRRLKEAFLRLGSRGLSS